MEVLPGLLSLTSLITAVTAECRSFNPAIRIHGDTSFTTTFNTLRASALTNCSVGGKDNGIGDPSLKTGCLNTECPLTTPQGYQLQLNRTLNVSTSAEAADNLFELARNSFQLLDKVNLNQTWLYSIGNYATCLTQGQAGYIGFTPIYRCTEGSFSQCSGAGYPTDGTAVQLCAVSTYTINPNRTYANGDLREVQTSGIDDQPAPANGTLPSPSATSTSSPNSGRILAPPLMLLASAVCMLLGWDHIGLLWTLRTITP